MFYKDVVLHNVVVCLQKFCYDEWFTVPEMSDGLAELLGYTKEEVEKKFKNRFIDIIYPGDREMVRHQVESQLRTGKTIEQEYRVIDRSGKIVWLLGKGKLIVDTDGNEYIYEAVLDITKSKEDQEELRLTLERHKIIMEQTNDIIFEWDILKDQVIYSSNWIKKFGYEPIKDNIRKKLSQVSHIHPQDCPLFLNFLDEFVKGVPYRETKIRLADGNGRYRWCRVRATAQFDPRGRALKVVGILNDADNIYMMKTPAEQKENPFLGL